MLGFSFIKSARQRLQEGKPSPPVSSDDLHKDKDVVAAIGEHHSIYDYLDKLNAAHSSNPITSAAHRELTKHLSYFYDKAKIDAPGVTARKPFTIADRSIFLDLIANTRDALQFEVTSYDLQKDKDIVAAIGEHHSIYEYLDKLNAAQQSNPITSDAHQELTKHLSYFYDKAKIDAAGVTARKPFTLPDRIIFMDLIENTREPLQAVVERQVPKVAMESLRIDGLPESVAAIIADAERDLQGWCIRAKSTAIAKAVMKDKPQVCVEIGVYGGRSLYPVAAALRENGSGQIYGVETWSPDVATEHVTNEVNDQWWRELDFHLIKSGFFRFLTEHDLFSQVRVVEAPSANAASLFSTIDYLHIDGAHSMYNAAEDVVLYGKKVKPGGTIVFDDVGWSSTAPAITVLKTFSDVTEEIKDDKGQVTCAIFRRR